MAKAKLTFHRCIQDSQDYGSDDEHMVSRVFFTLDVAGRQHPDLHADIKQAVGSSFETGPIEVGSPQGYDGPINYEEFRNSVEQYYRELVGSQGSGIRISGGSNIRMRNNTFIRQKSVEIEVGTREQSGW